MSADQITVEALRLSEKERAHLAAELLKSLPQVAFDDDEGLSEALRRDEQMDADPSQAMMLHDLDLHVRQRLKP